METYRATMDSTTTLVLSTGSDFTKFLSSVGGP
jgi:hypothetical protein